MRPYSLIIFPNYDDKGMFDSVSTNLVSLENRRKGSVEVVTNCAESTYQLYRFYVYHTGMLILPVLFRTNILQLIVNIVLRDS